MKCKNDPDANYTGNEPSPKGIGFCAHADPVGKARKGRDGQMWVVKQDRAGRRAWRVASTSTRETGTRSRTSTQPSTTNVNARHRRTVFITDNGSTPFVVHLPFTDNVSSRPGVAHVMHRSNEEEWTEAQRTDPTFMDQFVLWKSIRFIKAWVGLDPSELVEPSFFKRLFKMNEWWHGGNSMLLQTGAHTFVHIGDSIYEFQLQPKDEVVAFLSPMGNSAVPYPYIVGRDNTYLLIEMDKYPIYIPHHLLDASQNPYDQYYSKKEKHKFNSLFTKTHTVRGHKLMHRRV